MLVVSLRRLEGNRPMPRQRSAFYLVPKMIALGFGLALILIAVVNTTDSKPKKISAASQSSQAVMPAATAEPSQKFTSLDQLLPESGNPSTFMANKFLDTLPPPSPDCQQFSCVALTFDDGPNKDSTDSILDSLSRHQANATFFFVGNRIKGHEDTLRRMQVHQDEIGNHSWSHASFLTLKPEEIRDQVAKTQEAVKAAGLPVPQLFRPPYEDFKLDMQKDIKLPVILWNVDPKDWAYNDAQKIAETVKQQIKPGAIVVMHDKPATAAAVDMILTDLKPKYKFVTVSKLLNLQPSAKGVYVGR